MRAAPMTPATTPLQKAVAELLELRSRLHDRFAYPATTWRSPDLEAKLDRLEEALTRDLRRTVEGVRP